MFRLVKKNKKMLNNMKIDIEERGCEHGSWMHVAQVKYNGKF